MKLTQDQTKKAAGQFTKNIKNMDNITILHTVNKGDVKVNELNSNPPNVLKKFWRDIKLMLAILHDYMTGNYREIPWTSIVAIAAAMAYFVCPLDVIPDFIPGIGYIDDAAIITYALHIVHNDLKDYKNWKKTVS